MADESSRQVAFFEGAAAGMHKEVGRLRELSRLWEILRARAIQFECLINQAQGWESERERLLAALRSLANEASGFLAMANAERHGATNIRLLADRINQARDLLDGGSR